jgi:oligosaccharide 4-alpha-D-glucosyltransferase
MKLIKTCFGVLLFISGQLTAQQGKDKQVNASVINAQSNYWEFSRYGDHVLKASFSPADYKKNEQVSNAVIGKVTSAIVRRLATKQERAAAIGNILIKYLIEPGCNCETVKIELTSKKSINAKEFITDNYRGFIFELGDDEQIFGTGERALPLNRRGYKFNLYNNPWYGYENGADNLNYSVPFIISSKGYGIFFDNPSKGYMDIGKTNNNKLEVGFISGELNFYIIEGKNADEILQRYSALTGRQPIPNRWVFGNFMSRFGYRSEEQVKDIYRKMRADKFGLDAIIFDLFWFGDSIQHTLGNLAWINKEKWPDPKAMIAGFKKDSIKTILITEPFVLKNTRTYNESLKFHATDSLGKPFTLTDFYFGEGGIVDVFRKDSREWFKNVYRDQSANGVAGWWTDLGEPEKHPAGVYHNLNDMGFNRLFGADEVHNVFGHYWNKMLFDYYAKEYPQRRLFHLNRSGFAGSSRYCIFPWTGDVSRSWKGFQSQLPVLLGMSMSGVPYTHSDAGGFAMTDKADPELYTRWLQFAAFTPIFRPHGTALEDITPPGTLSVPSEPALWPESVKEITKGIVQLRYDMAPYNYTLAYEQMKYGKPLMRPLFYNNFLDSNLLKATDQYYWGDNILVAPVTEQGAVTKRIYLPKGKWYDWMRNRYYTGGQWINDSVDINHIPVLAKQGSFIPTVWSFKNMEAYNTNNLYVMYYPATTETSYTLYDDDGKTNNSWNKNQFELLTFKGKDDRKRIKISINSNGGHFPGKPSIRTLRLYVVDMKAVPTIASWNGKPMAITTLSKNNAIKPEYKPGNIIYYPASKMATVIVEFRGKPVVVELVK